MAVCVFGIAWSLTSMTFNLGGKIMPTGDLNGL
jgi:hypothetical protein